MRWSPPSSGSDGEYRCPGPGVGGIKRRPRAWISERAGQCEHAAAGRTARHVTRTRRVGPEYYCPRKASRRSTSI